MPPSDGVTPCQRATENYIKSFYAYVFITWSGKFFKDGSKSFFVVYYKTVIGE